MVLLVKLVLSCLCVLSLHLFFISVLKLLIWLFADQIFAPDPTRNGWGEGAYTWMQREEFSLKPEYAQKILYLTSLMIVIGTSNSAQKKRRGLFPY